MGCSVSRQLEVVVLAEEVQGPLTLDHNSSSGMSMSRSSTRSRNTTTKNTTAVTTKIKQSDVSAGGDIHQQDGEDQSDDTEEEPPPDILAQEEVNETPPQVNVKQNQDVTVIPLTWTKMACCGEQCQIASSRFCCEHDFQRPVHQYCQPCRERYEEWREANQTFEDMLRELEQTQQEVVAGYSSESHDDDDDDSASATNQQNTDEVDREEQQCPVCLDTFSLSSGTLTYLPCGHAVCHSHMAKLDKCPLCRTSLSASEEEDLLDASVSSLLDGEDSVLESEQSWGEQEEPNLETQTGRYELMNSPRASKTSRPTISWTTQVSRYLYLNSRGPVVSSLSLGEDESETSSMHSLSF